MRRPRFDFISPALLEEEFGDNDLLGNPDAQARNRLGRGPRLRAPDRPHRRRRRQCVLPQGQGPDRDRRHRRRVGSEDDGELFDPPAAQQSATARSGASSSTFRPSLGFIGLPDTGVFGNLSLARQRDRGRVRQAPLQRPVEICLQLRLHPGPARVRRGVRRDLPQAGLGLSTASSARKSRTTYGADLEVFVEKRFGDGFTDPRGRLQPAQRQEARSRSTSSTRSTTRSTATSTNMSSRRKRPDRCSSSSAGTPSDALPLPLGRRRARRLAAAPPRHASPAPPAGVGHRRRGETEPVGTADAGRRRRSGDLAQLRRSRRQPDRRHRQEGRAARLRPRRQARRFAPAGWSTTSTWSILARAACSSSRATATTSPAPCCSVYRLDTAAAR